MLKIKKVTVEYTENPVGIAKSPRFSWMIDSDRENVVQRSYEIQISTDSEFRKIVFSKNEDSDASLHHKYPEFNMKSVMKYYWRVRVRDNYGETSEFSEAATFVTAFLKTQEWQAEFITAETEDDADNSKGTCVSNTFQVKKEIEAAYVCCTALGLYQLYINGRKVGTDEMTPGWTSYEKHLLYQMYEVTEYIDPTKAEQCIGALLGAGFYKGKMGFLELRNNYGTGTAFLGQLMLCYRDGTTEIVKTDEDWIGADAPILFSEIYDGEIYDARKEIPDWCSVPQQEDAAAKELWRKVEKIPYEKAALYAQSGCKPAEMEKVPPKRIFKTPQGDLVVDFGQNMAGWIHVRVHGAAAGEKVEFACFETLDRDGNVYLDNLRGAKETIVYYCKGAETEEYHPHFTYQGFRYAKVVSYPGELKMEDVTAYAVYSNMELTGSFSSSNADLNQLWSNITWGLRSNFLDVPTDCPQRNERVGWTGDAQIFCRTASYIMNTYLFFEKWLIDVKADQTKEGGVPHVVPDIITPGVEKVDDWLLSQGTHSAAAWADVAVLNPWNLYLTFGDKQILIDQYESMKAWIRFMEKHSDGIIWNYKLQFGDWVALDAQEGSYYGATPNDLTCTAYYAYSTGIFAKIAGILGKAEDASYFENLEKQIKEGFAEHFFDPETKGMKVQTQTAHIIALYFDLTPDAYKKKTVEELLTLLEKENGHLVTGFVGTPYFTHALSQNGHLKEAYELLLKDDFPSWLYQVKQGATTVWEHWDGMKPDGTMWSPDMNSFNHYAYGAIGEWMYRVIAGIEIDEKSPGYKHVIFYPRPGGNLTKAGGQYESAYGTVGCEWQLEKDLLTVTCSVPVNTTAELRMDHVECVVSSGDVKYVITDGTYTAETGSGHYTWKFRLEKSGC